MDARDKPQGATGLGQAVAWSKFSPNEPPVDPMDATSEAAARRAWFLRWGVWISQGMLYLGFLFMLYFGFLRDGPAGEWVRAHWPF